MIRNLLASLTAGALVATACGNIAHAADPWADEVISYAPGTGVTNDFFDGLPYSNSAAVLGEPARYSSSLPATAPDEYGGVVTPLQSPFRSTEVVTIGAGGSLVVKFNEPVTNDPANPYGIDLLIFGNAFFVGGFFNADFSFNPAGTATGVAAEGGSIEVSANGVDYEDVLGEADGLFPTNAYVDVTSPFTTIAGSIPTDFTLPVNPAFNPVGKTYAEILAGYGNSGGGLGVDIASTGLSSISYVRITTPLGATLLPEIDGFADVHPVPEPTAAALAAFALILLGKNARARTV